MPRTDALAPPTQAPNKHQQRTAATTAKLLRAAYAVFARDGFEAASISDIAVQAGFTRGAFYAHFKTKHELFLALIEQRATQKAQRLREIYKGCSTREEGRAALREFYLGFAADKQWALLLLEFKLHALREPQLRAQLADAHRRVRQQLHASLESSTVESSTVQWHGREAVADCIRAGLEANYTALLLERAYDPKRISEAELRELLGRIFDALFPA